MTATQIQMRYEGDGVFRVASRLDRELADDAADIGEVIVFRPSKRRSGHQNRYYWAIITEAHENQTAGPLFETREQLRAWILCEIGHCTVTSISLNGLDVSAVASFVAPVASVLRKTTDSIVVSYDNGNHAMVIRAAKSTSYRKCGAELFGDLVSKTLAIISARICPGMDIGELEQQARAA